MDAKALIGGFISLIILLALVSGFYPVLVDYGNELNNTQVVNSTSQLPFSEFMADGGLAWIVLGIVVFIGALGLLGWKVSQ